ncbi:MAG: dihydroorotate dehydrogenase electron transfer subunit [Victivallales bacterium]|nr:dihydroorotate dehydrogenase electron transfer subunit [Victivallales bacterium]
MLEDAEIKSNECLCGDYRKVDFNAPGVSSPAQPGQFAHVRIPQMRDRILRRPFSICNVSEGGMLSIVYKVVGEGTRILSEMKPGEVCNLMGPQGRPFSLPKANEVPVIIAGGYGSAATYLLARRSPQAGILLLGARTSQDIILAGEYTECGFDVRLSTEDGSSGKKGMVTDLLEEVVKEGIKGVRFYACGPHGMLMAVATKLIGAGHEDAEMSLDHLMCCGVGACFACVVKVKDDNPDGWRYARTCSEGPVFSAGDIYC